MRGEVVPGPGDFEIEVADADPRRLKRLRIYRKKSTPAPGERPGDRDGKPRLTRLDAVPPAPRLGETMPIAPDAVADLKSLPGGGH